MFIRNYISYCDYRYGFNGMEKDDEVKGQGNHMTTPFRQYDPRIGRWMTMDPIVHVDQSPYMAFNNNPIYFADPSGLKGGGPNGMQPEVNGDKKGETFVGDDGKTYTLNADAAVIKPTQQDFVNAYVRQEIKTMYAEVASAAGRVGGENWFTSLVNAHNTWGKSVENSFYGKGGHSKYGVVINGAKDSDGSFRTTFTADIILFEIDFDDLDALMGAALKVTNKKNDGNFFKSGKEIVKSDMEGRLDPLASIKKKLKGDIIDRNSAYEKIFDYGENGIPQQYFKDLTKGPGGSTIDWGDMFGYGQTGTGAGAMTPALKTVTSETVEQVNFYISIGSDSLLGKPAGADTLYYKYSPGFLDNGNGTWSSPVNADGSTR
jgi:RHS repeat-associated protein